MSEDLKFLKSKRGKDICIHNGYIYNITTTKENLNKYRCKNRNCKGAILLDGENNIMCLKEHNHSVNLQEVNKLHVLSIIEQKTIETCEIADNIVHNSITELNFEDEMIQHLPKLKLLKDNIKKSRIRVLGYHPNITNDIPESLKFDKNGNKFLQFDSGLVEN